MDLGSTHGHFYSLKSYISGKLFHACTETAINIGYSCQLLTDEMIDIFIVDGHTFEDVEIQLYKYRESIRSLMSQQQGGASSTCNVVTFGSNEHGSNGVEDSAESFGGFAIVVNGYSLVWFVFFSFSDSFSPMFFESLKVICYL